MTIANTDHEQLREQNRKLLILTEIAQALNSEVDLDRALRVALGKVAELLDLQTGWVFLLHEGGSKSYVAAQQNLPPALADHPRRMGGTCYCLDTFRDGDMEGAANINAITCTRLKDLKTGTEGLREHASIPLYAHGKKMGILNVASTDWSELSPGDLQLLRAISDLLGIAVERARLFDQSAQLGAVEERNRLARELHDTLAQGLTSVALQLESADALLDTDADPARIKKAVRQALNLTRLNLEEARRSVLDLRAAPLEGRTLAEALAALAEYWAGRAPLQVDFGETDCGRPLPVRMEVGLYRIAQEAMNNVVQHANARHANIQLVCTPDHLTLTITDDGQGFDSGQVAQNRFGLVGMNERAHLLGGQLSLECAPAAGTRIVVEVPLL